MRIALRVATGVLGLCIAIGVLASAHYYIALRLILDPELPEPWRGLGLLAVAVLAALGVLQPIAERTLPEPFARVLAWPGGLWMGFFFLLLVTLSATDLALWALGAARGVDADPGALAPRLRAAFSVAVVGVLGIGAVLTALRGPRLVCLEISPARWTRGLDGLRLVQLSDIHIGRILRRPFAESLVRRVNALDPDLIVITGDLVDGRVDALGPQVEPFADLTAPLGVFFVTGNHDHYSDADPWVDKVRSLGIRVLRNQRVSLEHGSDAFELAGVDDHRGGFGGSTEDLERALAGRDPTLPLVLLAHDPATFRSAATAGVDLQLSGHTHGGQLWPFRYLVRLAGPFIAGLYRRAESQLYVSRGTGFWGPPMRLFAPAEITEITLRA
jgi:predicted MPP superfamily phosphohydrolase